MRFFSEKLLPRRRCWLGWALLGGCALLAGCVDKGANDLPASQGVHGGWTLNAKTECAQHLTLGTDGGFTWQTVLKTGALSMSGEVSGAFSGGGITNAEGEFQTLLSNSVNPSPLSLAYCGEWSGGEKTPLPFAAIAVASGIDPGALAYRPVTVPGRGVLLVGSGAPDADRFGLHLDSAGTLHGFFFSDHVPPPKILFHRDQTELIQTIPAFPGFSVINLPQSVLANFYPAAVSGFILDRFLLSINSAADVAFSSVPGSGTPACRFVLYETPSFLNPLGASQLTPDVDFQGRAFNPGDPDQFFYTSLFSAGGQTGTAFLLPLAVVSADGNPCSANVTGRPLSARLLEERLAAGGAVDAFSVALGVGDVFIPGSHRSLPTAFLPIPLRGRGTAWDGLTLNPVSVKPPPLAAIDLIGLGADSVLVDMVLRDDGAGAFLNIFPAVGSAPALGPFLAFQFPPTALPLALPETVGGFFAMGEGMKIYRFSLPSTTRIGIVSLGPADTAGRLTGPKGRQVAEDENGAADGVGFLMARTLPAGEYLVGVFAPAAGGSFQLSLTTRAAGPVPDENLEACLIAAGSVRRSPAEIRNLACVGRGISDLTAIGNFPNLARISLAGNRIADISPLAALTSLHALSLAGNPVESLNPLAALPNLSRLSLAYAPLDPSHLASLSAFGGGLVFLDLTGATGITDAEAAALKTTLVNALILTPSGTALE